MILAFIAHPLRGDIDGNLARAKEWYRVLSDAHPDRAFLLNWAVDAEMFDDSVEGQRRAGIERNMALIDACDELWVCGDAVTAGMQEEINRARERGLTIIRACGDAVRESKETLAGVRREVSDNRCSTLERLRRWFAPAATAGAEL